MENPFRYGIVVDDPYFIDRENEIKDISRSLKSKQSLVIYSPRRYGKTSLILKIINNLKEEEYNTIYIDFFKIHSRSQFISYYYNEVIKKTSSWEKAIKKIGSLVKGLRPVVSIDADGKPQFSVNYEESRSSEALSEVLDLPQKLASEKPWIVVFDEFQEVNKLNGDNFEKEMRACLIHHNNVAYVFMGSQTHMLLNMFTHKNKAFYQFAKLLELKKIPEPLMISFLDQGFSKSGFKTTREMLSEITRKAENIPHYVQYLASACWETAIEKDDLNEKVFMEAIDKIINNQQDYFMALYDMLTPYQQKVLLAITKEQENLFTQEYKTKYHLSSQSSTQRAIEKLIQLNILEKQSHAYHFVDPFFREWMEKMGRLDG